MNTHRASVAQHAFNRCVFALLVFCALAGCSTPKTGYQVVGFTATWCPVCQFDKPQLAALPVPLTMIDVDRQPTTADQYSIQSLPTYLLYQNGREILRTHDLREVKRRIE
jgi:thiol-disulfide isomerase/thioredoxin